MVIVSTDKRQAVLPRFARWPSSRWLPFLLFGAVALTVFGYVVATISFAQTHFPVDLFAWQLAFSAAASRAWYASLVAHGTLETFLRTQWLDYIFVFGLMATVYLANLAIARAHQPASLGRRIGLITAVIAPFLVASDALENITYFIMTANIATFPDWLALVSSSLSFIKWFAGAGLGSLLILAQLVALLIVKLKR